MLQICRAECSKLNSKGGFPVLREDKHRDSDPSVLCGSRGQGKNEKVGNSPREKTEQGKKKP